MISGEQFQSLAEISLYGEMNDIIAKQNVHISQNLIKISELSIDSISNYKIIFIYTHFIEEFFNKFYNFLGEDTVLISHNSDGGINQTAFKFLESNRIKKWFCQNREISHPKLFSIPIGLANSQWPHGNQNIISEIKNKNNKKELLVYKNFDINTNYTERNLCNIVTNLNNISMHPHVSIPAYWDTMSKSTFIISPPGNGIDCHRIWEALYLNCIPIVKNHEAFSQFKHLPIIFVNSWEEVTIDFLTNQTVNFNDFDIPMLDISFWKNQILA